MESSDAEAAGYPRSDNRAIEVEEREAPTFQDAIRGLDATGASVGMRSLVDLIVRHGAEEGELLSTYASLASEAPDEGVRYLVALILEDVQRRHHRLLAELSNAIAWGSSGKAATVGGSQADRRDRR